MLFDCKPRKICPAHTGSLTEKQRYHVFDGSGLKRNLLGNLLVGTAFADILQDQAFPLTEIADSAGFLLPPQLFHRGTVNDADPLQDRMHCRSKLLRVDDLQKELNYVNQKVIDLERKSASYDETTCSV